MIICITYDLRERLEEIGNRLQDPLLAGLRTQGEKQSIQ
jgi:hypothetical protein